MAKRTRSDETEADEEGDALGPRVERFGTAAGRRVMMIIAGVLAAVAVGLLATAAWIQGGATKHMMAFMVGGGGAAAIGAIAAAAVVLRASPQTFDIHKNGVRFDSGKKVVGLTWAEMDRIEFLCTVKVSGREQQDMRDRWEAFFHARGRARIRLSATLFDLIDGPDKMIRLLEKRSGMPIFKEREYGR